jgi:hypothetical protein
MDAVSYQINDTGHKTLHIPDLGINHVLYWLSTKVDRQLREKIQQANTYNKDSKTQKNEMIGGRQDVFCKLLQM